MNNDENKAALLMLLTPMVIGVVIGATLQAMFVMPGVSLRKTDRAFRECYAVTQLKEQEECVLKLLKKHYGSL